MLNNRSNRSQWERLSNASEHRFRVTYLLIPTYISPVSARELQSTTGESKELVYIFLIM
jgi:hypothetical protein